MIKFFGIADLLTAIIIVLLQFSIVSWNIAFIFAAYVIVKGLIFRDSIASYLDIGCGIYMIMMFFGLKIFLAYIVALYLAQKGVVSLF
jgi:hypothetical protein